MTRTPTPARLRPADLARTGAAGLRTRPIRAMLSAAGIAVGIASMLAVVRISASSQAELDRTLDRLGTNLLSVAPGSSLTGQRAKLPEQSPAMIARIGPVHAVSATGRLPAAVYRTDHIPSGQTSSIAVLATRLDLPATVGATIRVGTWLDAATAASPVAVLGSTAGRRLAVDGSRVRVWLGGQWFGVAGILDPVPLAPELDAAALIGWPAAKTWLGFDGHPTTIYTRSAEDKVEAVRAVLAGTAKPEHPEEVRVSRPSDALTAQRATNQTFTALLVGLGAVALLVGGVGVANTMIISVLERRAEIGLRRALGATRGHVQLQFLTESLLLSGWGGIGGITLGIAVTTAYASYHGWPSVVPLWASVGGFCATIVIGAIAGLYPAARASRLSPTEALATT